MFFMGDFMPAPTSTTSANVTIVVANAFKRFVTNDRGYSQASGNPCHRETSSSVSRLNEPNRAR
jgi:hypothetical protein